MKIISIGFRMAFVAVMIGCVVLGVRSLHSGLTEAIPVLVFMFLASGAFIAMDVSLSRTYNR